MTRSFDECLYYLVREDFNNVLEKDVYFEEALRHIRERGFQNLELCKVELLALINAAKRRNRLEELDRAVGGSARTWRDRG